MKANSKETKKALQELIMRGKEQGYLTYSEINDMLPEDLVTEDQIEPIVSVLEELDITITDEIPDADTLMVMSNSSSTETIGSICSSVTKSSGSISLISE